MTKRERQFEFSQDIVARLTALMGKEFGDIFRTGENCNTLTFATNLDISPYASIKLTLHKPEYNLDDEIEKFEMVWEEKELKRKAREEKEKVATNDGE